MKYTYAYKTSDGIRHEASMDAESREAVFAALRQRGIKAIKVVAADGSKANGEVRGVRKRVVAALVALVALGVGVAAYIGGTRFGAESGSAFQTDRTRRQLIGDSAVIEKGILTGWASVFEHEGERFLASFAVPGVKAGLRNTTADEIEEALKRIVLPSEGDSIEVRQIKAMVEGMKEEARRYVSAGGTIVEYGRRLTERQDAEIAIYERAKSEIEAARRTSDDEEVLVLWERNNERLRALGIKLVSWE